MVSALLRVGQGCAGPVKMETVLFWAGEMAQLVTQWEDWSLDPQKGMRHSKCCPSTREAEMGSPEKAN